MTTKVKKKKAEPKPFQYKIDFIRTISFFENHQEAEQVVKKGKCHMGFGLNIESKKGKLSFPVKVEFFPETGENVPLFGIETVHSFSIKDFKSHFKEDENGKFQIPDGFVERLLGIAISGTRGMIVASLKLPEYKNIFLPLVDISKLVTEMKQDPNFGKEEIETE